MELGIGEECRTPASIAKEKDKALLVTTFAGRCDNPCKKNRYGDWSCYDDDCSISQNQGSEELCKANATNINGRMSRYASKNCQWNKCNGASDGYYEFFVDKETKQEDPYGMGGGWYGYSGPATVHCPTSSYNKCCISGTCREDEGSCTSDSDCAGDLSCGKNCSFGKSGCNMKCCGTPNWVGRISTECTSGASCDLVGECCSKAGLICDINKKWKAETKCETPGEAYLLCKKGTFCDGNTELCTENIKPIEGCMDETFEEFNPLARVSVPTMCVTKVVLGCMDSDYTEYDPKATRTTCRTKYPLVGESCLPGKCEHSGMGFDPGCVVYTDKMEKCQAFYLNGCQWTSGECSKGLLCDDDTKICYNSPRKENQPCNMSKLTDYDCDKSEDLYCDADTKKCLPETPPEVQKKIEETVVADKEASKAQSSAVEALEEVSTLMESLSSGIEDTGDLNDSDVQELTDKVVKSTQDAADLNLEEDKLLTSSVKSKSEVVEMLSEVKGGGSKIAELKSDAILTNLEQGKHAVEDKLTDAKNETVRLSNLVKTFERRIDELEDWIPEYQRTMKYLNDALAAVENKDIGSETGKIVAQILGIQDQILGHQIEKSKLPELQEKLKDLTLELASLPGKLAEKMSGKAEEKKGEENETRRRLVDTLRFW